jgi:hypothetical protein
MEKYDRDHGTKLGINEFADAIDMNVSTAYRAADNKGGESVIRRLAAAAGYSVVDIQRIVDGFEPLGKAGDSPLRSKLAERAADMNALIARAVASRAVED